MNHGASNSIARFGPGRTWRQNRIRFAAAFAIIIDTISLCSRYAGIRHGAPVARLGSADRCINLRTGLRTRWLRRADPALAAVQDIKSF